MNKKLKKYREDKGLLQVDLAREANISPCNYSRYEKHGFIPTPKLQKRIAKVLEIDREKIFK